MLTHGWISRPGKARANKRADEGVSMDAKKETPEGCGPDPGGGQNDDSDKSCQNTPELSRLNRREAIRARCLDCSGFSAKEVRECPLSDCPLYPYRFSAGKQDPKKRDKAIRTYCRECMNGQRVEVYGCPSGDCPLFPYRHTGAKKSHIGKPPKDKITSEGDSSGGGDE
jgi:hypothetical protein